MNENKICFIYCVNDETQFQESLLYVQALNVPAGFEIELLEIRDAASMAAGYNEAMRSSDAKYKIYMHQDVFILNKDMLVDVVTLFRKYPRLGMLGVAGTGTIPGNGVWWRSGDQYGKFYGNHDGILKHYELLDVTGDYAAVAAVDGLFIVTQYDIPWREDLFTGWHFYDLSVSLEFRKAGYEVGVPRQVKPWCLHDNNNVSLNDYDKYRQKFIEEYRPYLRN